ncbi:OadG family protein [Thiopseudomonas alkaliphila]|uniref:OadG family protein n=1 Tax=Thiopseudomonas alkaliphila TaxID=1697053 RepID=UPI002578C73C|nr:OadG family protein [Thiopseudomonas alkaliphila]MDM1707958.1 OadG family protein [Thiopseudomonas alkaliphila]
MSPHNLLLEGVELMLFGMGFVFVFLILLIGCIKVLSAVLERFTPPATPTPVATPNSIILSDQPEPAVLQAIELAIKQHRARRS